MTNLLFLGGLGGLEMLIILIILIIPGILWIIALIDVLRSDFKDSINKLIWVIVILLFPIVGALIYFVLGRSQKI